MDEEDDATLANLFKTRHRRASTLAEHSPASKRRLSKACSVLNLNKEANAKNSSPRQIPRKGDIVWAKPFSHTCWPGQVNDFKGPLVSVSFFGCNETHLLSSSEILRFEEKYALMLKMVGGKLSYEIGLALDELSRNIAMGLKCSCMFSAGDEDGSSAVKRGFNPQEILGFVINKAVVPQVDEGEIATVVRVSAALNAFRHGLVVCKTSEVDKGFRAEGVLDFVLDLAVNPLVDGKAFAQLNAFRRFTSVKPDWFYRLDWELEDSLEVYKVEVAKKAKKKGKMEAEQSADSQSARSKRIPATEAFLQNVKDGTISFEFPRMDSWAGEQGQDHANRLSSLLVSQDDVDFYSNHSLKTLKGFFSSMQFQCLGLNHYLSKLVDEVLDSNDQFKKDKKLAEKRLAKMKEERDFGLKRLKDLKKENEELQKSLSKTEAEQSARASSSKPMTLQEMYANVRESSEYAEEVDGMAKEGFNLCRDFLIEKGKIVPEDCPEHYYDRLVIGKDPTLPSTPGGIDYELEELEIETMTEYLRESPPANEKP